jgi:hypothetical protein
MEIDVRQIARTLTMTAAEGGQRRRRARNNLKLRPYGFDTQTSFREKCSRIGLSTVLSICICGTQNVSKHYKACKTSEVVVVMGHEPANSSGSASPGG